MNKYSRQEKYYKKNKQSINRRKGRRNSFLQKTGLRAVNTGFIVREKWFLEGKREFFASGKKSVSHEK